LSELVSDLKKSTFGFAGAVLGLGLVGSIGTMMGAIYTPPENSAQKHLFWLVSVLGISAEL
jgi:hypothetical protein